MNLRHPFRPQLVSLEARDVPATVTWDTAAHPTGGEWTDPVNWVGGAVPAAGDDAVIALNKVGTVTFTKLAGATVGSLTTSAKTTFAVNKGTLTLAASVNTGVIAGDVTVGSKAALAFGAGAKVQLAANASVTVDGTFTADSPALLAAEVPPGISDRTKIEATATGLVTFTNATLTQTGSGAGFTIVYVDGGGRLVSHDSTIGFGRVRYQAWATAAAGDVTNTAFDTFLITPVGNVPALVGNPRFQGVALYGDTAAKVTTLAPLGLDASQQYYTVGGDVNKLTVTAGTTLKVAPGTDFRLAAGATLTVDGTLAVDSPAAFTLARGADAADRTSVTVNAGGLLAATTAAFTTPDGGDGITNVVIEDGARLAATGSTFGTDRVILGIDCVVGVGDVTGNTFDAFVVTPPRLLPALANNARFQGVGLNGPTVAAVTTLSPLGADPTTQKYFLGYVDAYNLTVSAGTTLNVVAGTSVRVAVGGTVTVAGTLTVDPAAVVFATRGDLATDVTAVNVVGGGVITATGAAFQASGKGLGVIRVSVGKGATFDATGSAFGWDELTYTPGSAARLRLNEFDNGVKVTFAASTDLAGNAVRDNDFGGGFVLATGATGKTIDLTNNFWGTTTPAAIDARITDSQDDPTRPTVVYAPFLPARPVRPTVVAPAPRTFNTAGTSVPLSATFLTTSSTGLAIATDGTATFTVRRADGSAVSTPTTVPVAGGSAAGTVTLPGGTPAGTYTLRVEYRDAAGTLAATDDTQSLTVNAAAQAIAFGPLAPATYGVGPLTLAATGGGSGNAVGFAVVGGPATLSGATLTVTGAGTVVVRATQAGDSNHTAAPAVEQTLTVNPAATTTVAAGAGVSASSAAQAVTLTAVVTSPAGSVAAGTVTFRVLDGATPVGIAVPAAVGAGGVATASYTLPAGLAAGTYAVEVSYAGTTNLLASADATARLTASVIPTTTVAPAASAAFSPAGQTLAVSATVTGSAAVTGTVTFTLFGGGGATVGIPVTATLAGGAAAAGYALPAGTPAGAYTLRARFAGTSLLAGSEALAAVAISQAPQAVAFGPLTPATYGVGPLTLAATGGGSGNAVGFAVVGGPATLSGATLTVTGAGTVVVRATQAGSANYATATAVEQTLTVAPAPLMLVALDATAVAGGALPALAFRADGLVRGDTPAVVTGASVTTAATAASPAGAYPLTVVGGTAANYAITRAPGTLTLTAAPVVTAPGREQALQGVPQFAVGTDGGDPTIRVYDPDGSLRSTFPAFDPGTPGGVRTAAADLTGTGRVDVVVGTGPGTSNRVRVLNGATGDPLADFQPFEAAFAGGVFVTLGDVTGDGVPDLVVTPDETGGPIVVVYDGAALARGQVAQLNRFFGIEDPDFRGGARAAVGLVNGKSQVIVSAGFGGGPRIAVFDGRDVAVGTPKPGHVLPDFFAFEPAQRNGAYVAAGDIAGAGSTQLIFGAGPGGGPRVRVIDTAKLLAAGGFSNLDEVPTTQVANFFAGDTANRGGVRVAVKRLDATSQAGLVTGAGTGAGSRVTGYTGATLLASGNPKPTLDFDDLAGFTNGVFVG